MEQPCLELRLNGAVVRHPLGEGAVVLGKDPAQASVVLNDPAVSRRHAEIVRHNGRWLLRDLNSSNHTFVNAQQISEHVLQDQDRIAIHPFELLFLTSATTTDTELRSNPPVISADRADDALFEIKKKLHREFLKRMELKKINLDGTDPDELRNRVRTVLGRLVEEHRAELAGRADAAGLEKELLDDILGLGPLEDLANDPAVSEIMVNNRDQVYYERGGKLFRSAQRFYDDAQLLAVIERIIAPTGRSINETSPMVDTRLLRDGSRVNAVIPPLAVKGPCLTIRKFSKKMLTPDHLVGFGSLHQAMVDFLRMCVLHRRNIIVSGGTGSGKTTLLNILSSFVPADERVVTVEDAAELQLQQEHVITLEARAPNLEGKGAVTIRDLVRNCLRMRPDRIIVGECRGAEALDMLQAMNTGHDGSLTTVHANTPRDAIVRLETMVLMTGMDLPLKAVRNQIEAAVDIFIQQSRFPDGSRKVTHITEVTGMENDVISTQDIFRFEQQGYTPDGKVVGAFRATGAVPAFYDELKARGVTLDYTIFTNA